jgi:phenylpropionate dioxygenase-like ring-hydroxylating dioxygenase large terminal subunit
MSDKLRDRCGLLKNYWYAAALGAEVSSRRPLGCEVLGERVVLFRDRGGRAVAMLDRCLHRNALLSRGEVFDGCLGCPYHGWTYDASGRCVHIPSQGPGSRAPEGLALQTFRAREQDGIVWVWMGDGEPDKEPFRMPSFHEPGWGAYYMSTRFSNGVTNLVENFMDVPHTVFVHKGWFRTKSSTRVPTSIERTRDSVLVTYDQPGDSIGWSTMILNPKRLPLVHTDKFYMPGNTRVDYVYGREERAFVITSTCTPVSEFDTRVYTLISYKLGWFNAVGRLFLPFYTRRVIEQDVEIMQNQGESLRHHGPPRFHSTAADALHLHIEALRGWDEGGGVGPRPEPVVERVEMWI